MYIVRVLQLWTFPANRGVACVAGARRGRGQGKSDACLNKGSAQEGGGGGSACSKPIVWLVFHGHFLIVKIAIGQN